MLKTGFAPIISKNARLLILGSMPGEKSLNEQQYYAHPQNAFWFILSQLLQFDPGLSYARRTRQLTQHRIALWDVIEQCRRQGSLDSAIQNDSIRANDFNTLFCRHKDIRFVCFNGQKAAQEFRRQILPTLDPALPELEYHTLPSTSPANARLDRHAKLAHWSKILTLLNKA